MIDNETLDEKYPVPLGTVLSACAKQLYLAIL